ncbi:MAG: hypothetical protein WDZ51_03875 [Pirellulaceae bacterium]
MMDTRFIVAILACLGVCASLPSAQAEGLVNAGVIGNSGEQGETLVRFADKPASGMGVVYDKYGSLWDRGGAGRLLRFAVDGRLLATYPMAENSDRNQRDTVVLFDDLLMLKLGKKLYTLPLDAPAGTEPETLPTEATRLSFGTHEGWAAAANDKKVFLVNRVGETRDVATLESGVEDIEIGPEGGVYARTGGKFIRVDDAAAEDQRGPWTQPGDRPQWLANHWYGHAGHGTIRRFNRELGQDPGVVLGGASGTFIGYVEGNHELDNGRGMAHLGGNLFAVSGLDGGVHLLHWLGADQRFEIVRRIDSSKVCDAVAIDSQGRIWFNSGFWHWSDGPDAPLRHSQGGITGLAGGSTLENDVVVVPGSRWNSASIFSGKLEGQSRINGGVDEIPKSAVASTVISWDKKTTLVVVDRKGAGVAYYINNDGRASGKAGDVRLRTESPIESLTSLAPWGEEGLLAAADGHLIEFAREGGAWQEQRRWREWESGDEAHFGGEVYVAASHGRVWVSDTDRQRVLCFDQASGQPLGTFGTLDEAGDDLATLDSPRRLAANGERGIVFDAGNQRFIRLELTGPSTP